MTDLTSFATYISGQWKRLNASFFPLFIVVWRVEYNCAIFKEHKLVHRLANRSELGFCTAIIFHLFTVFFLRICSGSSLYSYSCMIYRHLQTFLHLVCNNNCLFYKSNPLLIRIVPWHKLLSCFFLQKSCCSLHNNPVVEEGPHKFGFQQCWEKMGEIIVFLIGWGSSLLNFMGKKK